MGCDPDPKHSMVVSNRLTRVWQAHPRRGWLFMGGCDTRHECGKESWFFLVQEDRRGLPARGTGKWCSGSALRSQRSGSQGELLLVVPWDAGGGEAGRAGWGQ